CTAVDLQYGLSRRCLGVERDCRTAVDREIVGVEALGGTAVDGDCAPGVGDCGQAVYKQTEIVRGAVVGAIDDVGSVGDRECGDAERVVEPRGRVNTRGEIADQYVHAGRAAVGAPVAIVAPYVGAIPSVPRPLRHGRYRNRYGEQ